MCTRPNYMYWCGEYHPSTGKEMFHFLPHCCYDDILKSGVPFVQVPCGKCLECRQQNASSWADRCTFEAMSHEFNYFVTLTYDDDHMPPNGSLVKEDFDSFIKSLRNYFDKHYGETGIKYFGCGEYSPSLRPHYHILLFNCNLRDLSDTFMHLEDGILKKTIRPNGNFFSKVIFDCWDRKGLIDVGKVEYNSAAYVAGYVEKKTNIDRTKKLEKLGLIPEFHRMSNGIGQSLFSEDLFSKNHIIVPKKGNAKISAIPRYYEKLLDKELPWVYNDVKERQALNRREKINNYIHSSNFYDRSNYVKELRLQKMHNEKL